MAHSSYDLLFAIQNMLAAEERRDATQKEFIEAQQAAFAIWQQIGPFDQTVIAESGAGEKNLLLNFRGLKSPSYSFVQVSSPKSLFDACAKPEDPAPLEPPAP